MSLADDTGSARDLLSYDVHSLTLALNGPAAEDAVVGGTRCFVGQPGRDAVVTNRVFSRPVIDAYLNETGQLHGDTLATFGFQSKKEDSETATQGNALTVLATFLMKPLKLSHP